MMWPGIVHQVIVGSRILANILCELLMHGGINLKLGMACTCNLQVSGLPISPTVGFCLRDVSQHWCNQNYWFPTKKTMTNSLEFGIHNVEKASEFKMIHFEHNRP